MHRSVWDSLPCIPGSPRIGNWLVASTLTYTCVYMSGSDSFQHRWIFLWWTKMQMWSDSHPEVTLPHPKSHSWKQGFWYWHLIKYALSHNSATCLSLKTRACTTDPLIMHRSHGLFPPVKLKFPCGQSRWEGSGLVSKYIPSGYVKTVCCHFRGLQLFLHPCRILIHVGVRALYKERQELQPYLLYHGGNGCNFQCQN